MSRYQKEFEGLNPQQQDFVLAYAETANATQSAVKAGYSEATAYQQAYRMLKLDKVKNAIACVKQRSAKRVDVSADDILREVVAMALYDPADYVDAEGNQLPLDSLTREQRRAIATVNTTPSGKATYKLADRPKSLELLGKHFSLFADRIQIEAVDLTAALQEAQERAARLPDIVTNSLPGQSDDDCPI